MKLRGKRGFESGNDGERWSRLFLLIRMGRNTPWEHVAWLIALARKERIYKIQLATSYRKEPLPIDSPYFHPEPVEFPCTSLEGKLALFSSTRDQPDKIRRHVHVAAVAWTMRDWAARDGRVMAFVESATDVVYRFGGRVEPDPDAIRTWLAGLPEPDEDAPWPTPVALTVDPRVPTRFVVAAIDRIKNAGFEKVDLLDHVTAPESRFRSPQVPYPRR